MAILGQFEYFRLKYECQRLRSNWSIFTPTWPQMRTFTTVCVERIQNCCSRWNVLILISIVSWLKFEEIMSKKVHVHKRFLYLLSTVGKMSSKRVKKINSLHKERVFLIWCSPFFKINFHSIHSYWEHNIINFRF